MKTNKTYLILLVLISLHISLRAEQVEHENILKIRYGWVKHLDPYLSPLSYNGQQIGIGNEWWQAFRQDSKLGNTGKLQNWAHIGRIDVFGLRAYSASWSNYIYGFGFHGGWGAYYKWILADGRIMIHLGPYLEADFMAREMGNNVNKPVSFDLGIDAMAMGGISWHFYGKKTSYRLRYLIRTNLIGFDYLPDYWQSMYEVTEGVSGLARCSGHWNHNVVRHELTLDLQFPHSTWRIGCEHEYLYYATKDMQFLRNQVNIVIGCIWSYKITSNKKL